MDLKKYKERVNFVAEGGDPLFAENAKRVANMLNGYSNLNMDENAMKNSTVAAEKLLYQGLTPIFDKVFHEANKISLEEIHSELVNINEYIVKFFEMPYP